MTHKIQTFYKSDMETLGPVVSICATPANRLLDGGTDDKSAKIKMANIDKVMNNFVHHYVHTHAASNH